MQYDYAAAFDRFKATCLARNRLDELVLIACTDDQRYGQTVHDGERHGLSEVTDLDVQVHKAGDTYWCSSGSRVPGLGGGRSCVSHFGRCVLQRIRQGPHPVSRTVA